MCGYEASHWYVGCFLQLLSQGDGVLILEISVKYARDMVFQTGTQPQDTIRRTAQGHITETLLTVLPQTSISTALSRSIASLV